MHYYNSYPMMDGYGFGGGWGILMMAVWVVLFVLIGFLIVRAFRHQGPGMHGMHEHHSTDPIDIVKERYAKGEITKDQFESLKKDLK